mmetsp:Transcript_90476/g.260696  ORF Transcript_90476/g.260696 Transcript_90476/m.260696 type:complete len:243 (-) Transcript_90476:416-1144(-)
MATPSPRFPGRLENQLAPALPISCGRLLTSSCFVVVPTARVLKAPGRARLGTQTCSTRSMPSLVASAPLAGDGLRCHCCAPSSMCANAWRAGLTRTHWWRQITWPCYCRSSERWTRPRACTGASLQTERSCWAWTTPVRKRPWTTSLTYTGFATCAGTRTSGIQWFWRLRMATTAALLLALGNPRKCQGGLHRSAEGRRRRDPAARISPCRHGISQRHKAQPTMATTPAMIMSSRRCRLICA